MFAGHWGFEMLDQGFQLYVGIVTSGLLANWTRGIPRCFANVTHIVPIVAHPDWRAKEVVACLTLEACPYGLRYSLLRHDEFGR